MKKSTLFVILAVTAAAATIVVLTMAVNIFERKQEGRQHFFKVVELNDDIDDPAVWGRNFPQQYADFRLTVDMTRTRYGAFS